MPEVYTLRAPEHFNYNNIRRPSPVKVKNNQKAEMHHLTPNYDRRTPSVSPRNTKFNNRPSTVLLNKQQKSPVTYQALHERKPEMYHLSTPKYSRQSPSVQVTHQKPKSNNTLTHSTSPSQNKVTTYMITAPNEDHFLPNIPQTPSPSIPSNRKKQFVYFDTIDHNDKQQHVPPVRYVPLSHSRATESIQRSMNKYRFR